MKTVILTSRMDTHDYDESGVRVAHYFGNENGIYELSEKYDRYCFCISENSQQKN